MNDSNLNQEYKLCLKNHTTTFFFLNTLFAIFSEKASNTTLLNISYLRSLQRKYQQAVPQAKLDPPLMYPQTPSRF